MFMKGMKTFATKIQIIVLCLFQKSLTIFNSALYGGAVVATGVDYFVENSIMLLWVWDKVRAKESEDNPCWFSWAILMIWPVLLIFGKYYFK